MGNVSLIPANILSDSQEFLEDLGATKVEIDLLQTLIEGRITDIITRVERDVKYADFPIIKLVTCPCSHGCDKHMINGVNICDTAAHIMVRHFPEIKTTGVNAGVLWDYLIETGYGLNWVDNAANIVKASFTTEQKRLVKKFFPKNFKKKTF